jgi:hypothetical protein
MSKEGEPGNLHRLVFWIGFQGWPPPLLSMLQFSRQPAERCHSMVSSGNPLKPIGRLPLGGSGPLLSSALGRLETALDWPSSGRRRLSLTFRPSPRFLAGVTSLIANPLSSSPPVHLQRHFPFHSSVRDERCAHSLLTLPNMCVCVSLLRIAYSSPRVQAFWHFPYRHALRYWVLGPFSNPVSKACSSS